jgi:hypothetical protein
MRCSNPRCGQMIAANPPIERLYKSTTFYYCCTSCSILYGFLLTDPDPKDVEA